MVDVVSAARARIAELKQEIEMLEGFVSSADEISKLLGGIPSPQSQPNPHDSETARPTITVTPREPTRPRERITGPKASDVIPAAIEILIAAGKPMSRRKLYEALKMRGLEVLGVDPIKGLGTILWRARDKIEHVEGEGYWPIGFSRAIPA